MSKFFYFLLKKSRLIVASAVVGGVISGISSTGLIALIHQVLSRQSELSSATLIWQFVGLVLVATLSGIFSQWLSANLAQKTMATLRMDLSHKIVASPLRHLEELGSHRLLATFTDDVAAITRAMSLLPIVIINGTILVSGTVYIAWLSWTGFLALLGFIALGILIYQMLARKALLAMRVAREERDALFKHFRALTDGIKALKLHRERCECFLSQSLHPTLESVRHYNIDARGLFIASENLTRFLLFVLFGLLIFALPHLKATNTTVLTGYALTILYLYRPLGAVMDLLPHYGEAAIAVQKLQRLGLSLAEQATEVGSNPRPAMAPSWKCLQLRGVTHTYYREKEDDRFTLGPIDLVFHRGELVFLVGGNGSGKTTLAKIITGLYPPETGEIRLDGEPITDQNRTDYRQLFSAVFSDFYLFENLLGLGSPGLDAQAQDYLIQLQLHHKVKVHHGTLSTTELSQGQRKRLALLTAYLEDRPFYVFDEWASDQDPLFKKIFYMQLLPELKARGKTVLAITHDDRYFHLADRCIKMEDGRFLL